MESNTGVDLTLCSVACVFGPLEPPPSLSGVQLESILRPPLQLAQGIDGRFSITSTRQQIEVQLSSNKIEVRDLSGKPELVHENIPGILSAVVGLFPPLQFKSYGINFVAEILRDDPEQWLGDHLLSPVLACKFRNSVTSNNLSFSFVKEPKSLTIKFTPRPNSNRIEVNFNSSEDIQTLPKEADLKILIGEQYSEFVEMVGALES